MHRLAPACKAVAAPRGRRLLLRGASATSKAGAANEESNFSRYAGMAFFSAIAVGTACLGTWQTQRYYWKVDLVEDRKKQLEQDPVDIPSEALAHDVIDEIEYRKLRVQGKYKPDSTFYLYPRSAPADGTESVASVKTGGYIYSLLEREGGTPVIVNRGWLPRNLLDIHIAAEKKEDGGLHDIVGVVRHGEVRNKFTPDNDVKTRQFFYLDHEELAQAMGLGPDQLPIILDEITDSTKQRATLANPVLKTVQNYMEFYMSPEKHVGYAATWFGCSIASVVMGVLRFRKKKVGRGFARF